MKTILRWVGLTLILWSGGGGSAASLKPNADQTAFSFETERMLGTITVTGSYHGVTRLQDRHTGRELIDSRYSALNLYKLMSRSGVMGAPRKMERTSRSGPNWVEIIWSSTEAHVGTVVARYEVKRSDAIDLTLTVRVGVNYADYEVFLPSYFDKSMRAHLYLKRRGKSEAPDLVMPSFSDAFATTLPVFARDSRAAQIPLDGRWDGIVDFSPMRRYAHCLAFMVDPDNRAAAVLMADPRDCFGISVRYHAADATKRLTSYSAFDLGLIGHDLKPGAERIVRARLALTDLDEQFSQPLKLYQSFLAETPQPAP
ncbi:MAG: hypothetical protein ACKVHO_16715 [Verrucomicrobiia bacterium]|jgi:hypothetical protein